MKKCIVTISVILLILITSMLVFKGVVMYLLVAAQADSNKTLLLTSECPNGEYKLEAYRIEPGATVDFSVKVYLIQDKNKIIYNAYHESEVEITWIDCNTVSINTKNLDLSKGETYDWRR